MKRVQGIGGIFLRAKQPEMLQAWYDTHLGIGPKADSPWGADDPASLIEWRDSEQPERKCYTVFGIFPEDTDYFGPDQPAYMLNLRVDNLDAVLAQLAEEGIMPISEITQMPFGRFVRILDPEGNPLELWEPAAGF